MDQLKKILLEVQTRLGEQVPEFACVDKDWGQLSYEQPAVKFPCALLDMKNINYSQIGKGGQMADAQLTVTVANSRLVSSSLIAPNREDAYQVVELLGKVHAALNLFTTSDFAPLFRTNQRKVFADSSKECYEVTFQTAYQVGFDTGESLTPAPGVKIEIQ